MVLVAGAVCAGAAAVALIAAISPRNGARRPNAITEAAAELSPEMAALLLAANDVAVEILEAYPDTPEAHNLMARLHYRLHKMEGAVEHWEKCLELDPDFGPAYHSMGIAALESGNHAKAEEYFRKAIEQQPESSTFPVQLAEELNQQGKFQEAVEVLEKNLKVHPQSLPSFALLGHAYLQLKDYEEARKCLEAAIEIGPEYTNAYYSLGRVYANLGDKEKSEECFGKFKALKAKDVESHRSDLKVHDDVANFRYFVAQTHVDAANVHLIHVSPVAADAHLVQAARIVPMHLPARRLQAWLYQTQGRTDEAVQVLDDLREMAPDDTETQLLLAKLYARMNCLDKAEEACRRAVELAPFQAAGYAILADFYVRNNRKLPEARKLATKAVELEPVAKNYFVLAMTCHENGDMRAAASAIERAIALEPNNVEYRRAGNAIREKL